MSREKSSRYPNIVPCLVQPFEKVCEHAGHRYAALVFAQRGPHILFAAEHARRFGVGVLDAAGRVAGSSQHPTLDLAARAFLAAPVAGDS
ncbi:MAG TPA: hypothetical protein VH301_10220 [Usitatibacter sp.]|jgi:hypothetical protein|nr:hypothetical protein [Usitatibacter sp.]